MAASGQNGIITYAELDLEAGGKGPPKPPTQETQPMLYTEMSQFQPEGPNSLTLKANQLQVQPTTRRSVGTKVKPMGVSTKVAKGDDKRGAKRKCQTRRQYCLLLMVLLVVCLAGLTIYVIVEKPDWAVHLWNQFCEAVGLAGNTEQGEGNLISMY